GLSLALVVVEMPTEKSGVMHSVNHAIEQGRDVFVVPANIDAPTSQASNALIAEGFQSASTGWQVLRDYARQFPKLQEEIRDERRLARPPIRAAVREDKARPSTKKEIDKVPKEVYIDVEALGKDRSEAERAVLACLGQEPVHVDEIVAKCGLPVQKVSVCLTTLGIADYIREHPGKRYSINPKIRSSR
ncbi:MAG: DNA-processing protein DprA, partial [Oscillospiraceae bacterium]|nr:DNA-processing protein DprA [Oscillospiraceae bacterium]